MGLPCTVASRGHSTLEVRGEVSNNAATDSGLNRSLKLSPYYSEKVGPTSGASHPLASHVLWQYITFLKNQPERPHLNTTLFLF